MRRSSMEHTLCTLQLYHKSIQSRISEDKRVKRHSDAQQHQNDANIHNRVRMEVLLKHMWVSVALIIAEMASEAKYINLNTNQIDTTRTLWVIYAIQSPSLKVRSTIDHLQEGN